MRPSSKPTKIFIPSPLELRFSIPLLFAFCFLGLSLAIIHSLPPTGIDPVTTTADASDTDATP